MTRVLNFSAGPAALPIEVLEKAQSELINWHGIGSSVMEVSHRGKVFTRVAEQAEVDLRDLLKIPDDYHVLFLQGGATLQFSMVPINLLRDKNTADYIETGSWSKKAIAEAKRFANVNIAATDQSNNYTRIPSPQSWNLNNDAAYLHYTANETIGGVEFHDVPNSGGIPLVSDMSSTLLSRPLDVSKFGLIYAGAQKNIGPAGLTVVIVRKDLTGTVASHTPSLFDYKLIAESRSMLNTPPTFAWYMAGLVFAWLKDLGGLSVIAEINKRKSDKLYQVIDDSTFYNNPVEKDCRSWMNIPFTLENPELDKKFLQESEEAGLIGLKGHRSVGGMRASLYNAMPESGVDVLINFMQDFEMRFA